MAVYPNGSYVSMSPSRFRGPKDGAVVTSFRGGRYNRYTNASWSRLTGGLPPAMYPPGAMIFPLTAGAVMSRGNTMTLTGGLNLAAGRNIDGSSTLTLTAGVAQLQLVVSGTGSGTMTLTGSGSLAGGAFITGSTTLSLTASAATLGAIASMVGSGTATLSGSAVIRALGNLTGNITPYTELSPENLAIAVWEALASSHIASGTMGEKLNAAGSGGLSPTQSDELTAASKALQLGQFLALK